MANEQTGKTDSRAKTQTAPAPDDTRKPSSPPQVKKPSWKYILGRTVREFSRDKCTDLAASLVYYAMLSMFPALLALVSLLGLFGNAQQSTDAVLNIVGRFAPGAALDVLKEPIQQLASSRTAGLAFVVGILGAVWSASAYVRAFGRAMNRIYEIDEGRPIWKLRPIQLLITVVLLVMAVIVAVLLVISGPISRTIGDAIGLGNAAVMAWDIAKWPVLVAFAIFMIAILYYATPNVQQPKFRWLSLGSVIALVVLALVSLGFAVYIANFNHYNKAYGAIGSVIILLLWLWLANLSLLFGAEFDAETERGRELQGGIKAEKSIQLPPRDTRASDKKAKKEEEEVSRGRALRLKHSAQRKHDE